MPSPNLGTDITWTNAALAVALTLVVAWIAATLATRVARLLLVRAGRGPAGLPFSAPIVRAPLRVIRFTVFLLVGFVLIVPALELAGAQIESGVHAGTILAWLLRSGLRVVLIALLAYAVIRLVAISTGRMEQDLARGEGLEAAERAKRARTVGNLLRNVINTTVIILALLMSLHELDIDILPILTGAGIAGLAVGFGAQTLVRDIISGFFLIFENQVRVGDVVTIGTVSGLVEAINLRTIVLRDLSGTVHVIPNGTIDRLSNQTKDFSYYVIDLGVSYREDTDRVASVLQQVAADLSADADYRSIILGPLEVLGVDEFGESQVTIKLRIKTVPLKQWDVGRELRRRIKKAFDAQGIEMPLPQRTIYVREGSRPVQ